MATWPSNLPSPIKASYAINMQDQCVRTDFEAGNPRVRRRTAARIDLIDVSWTFTDAELAEFRAWYEDSSTGISGGAGWFQIDLAVGDTGINTVDARFTRTFVARMQPGLNWTVESQLETRGTGSLPT
ncbi:MAG: hypothetical protein MUF16_05000 [Burkholderiaceae bacterium]|jgi:hypothetical protein|nr:hypothetical protein [Burkholderiaceae bacterium]